MNIQEAKLEMKHTVQAYLKKDGSGRYRFPAVRQRPVLLMGPPGIGKTAIMEQLAEELGIHMVSYTMTHHTRQSAVGLPQISEVQYGEDSYAVTRYTMSEVIASVYDAMAQSSCKEGILFLDEINCVSDTLAPTMLQFLQNKTFGTHRLPEGWIIAAAGNPPEYNKSVREFDIVTLDRIRRIDIQPDTEVFLQYASDREIHPAIRSYLKLYPEAFYHVSRREGRTYYVTARGWEDLSALLVSYEELKIEVTEEIISEFLCLPETSRAFFTYYRLFLKYHSDYGIVELLAGQLSEEARTKRSLRFAAADFVERFAVTEMVIHAIRRAGIAYMKQDEAVSMLHEALRDYLRQGGSLAEYVTRRQAALLTRQKFGFLKASERTKEEALCDRLCQLIPEIPSGLQTFPEGQQRLPEEKQQMLVQALQEQLDMDLVKRAEAICGLQKALANGITWMEQASGNGQELTALLTAVTAEPNVMHFLARHGCTEYLNACDALQLRVREQELVEACRRINTNNSEDRC